jgi:hypothetical protein
VGFEACGLNKESYMPLRPRFTLILGETRVIDSAVAWTGGERGRGSINFIESHVDKNTMREVVNAYRG